MAVVVIVGAGPIGSNVAHLLARRDATRRIHLLDNNASVAKGKALDIMQAAPIERFSTHVEGSSDLTHLVEATAVVLADDAGGTVWDGDAGVAQLSRVRRLTEGRPVICADACHRRLIERGVGELGYPRERLFGSAPEALASAARAMVALELNGSPRDVALVCLGVPPSEIVVPWDDVSTGAGAAIHALDTQQRRRVESSLPALWPPGPIALAAAAVEAVAAALGHTRRHVIAFVAPDDRMGRKARTAMWPVALSTAGVVTVHCPNLTGHDRTALENATVL